MEEKKRVYIMFKDDYYENRQFVDVFFSKEAAEDYISGCKYPHKCSIEVFEETDNGRSKEIY